MNRSERHEIEHECAKLINRFYHLFNVELSSVVNMFTEDGTMTLIGWKLGPGPEAMREPLRRALSGYRAWITGQRRDQSPTRADVPVIHVDGAFEGSSGELLKLKVLRGW